MKRLSPVTILLTILAYVVSTFAVQGLSHFGLNADHFAGISIMRDEPVVALGVTSMVIQGTIFALLFPSFQRDDAPVRSGVFFAWAIGAFLASYIALGEAGKYAIPSIPAWMVVEVSAAFVQFTVFGVLLGLIHRQRAAQPVRQPAPAR